MTTLYAIVVSRMRLYLAIGVLSVLPLGALQANADEVWDFFVFRRGDRSAISMSNQLFKAVELAKLEAEKRSVDLTEFPRYTIFFEGENLFVAFGRPYLGPFDGPEIRVGLRRSDLKIISFTQRD
jgi:hypothetical protein